MAFLLLVQVKRFWAVANKTHLSVVRGALLVFQVAVTKLCSLPPDWCPFVGPHQPRRRTRLINHEVSVSR